MFHPELPSCEECKKWMVDTGWKFVTRATNERGPDGTPLRVRVPNQGKTPCGVCPKVPKDMPPRPESSQELSDRNLRCYLHYLECRATDSWPTGEDGKVDAVVKRNASVIRGVHDAYDRHKLREPLEALRHMIAVKGA